jgi:selenide,water dikinase
MAVTGVVHPRRVVRNSTGRAGDVLFLTKPVGGGAVTTAAKRGMALDDVVRRSTRVMTELNAAAADAATAVGVAAMTDVSGFGLLGHLRELALASGVAARVEAAAVPAVEGALELLAAGALAGGSRRNREWLAPHVHFAESIGEPVRALLCDAMTSGGLLIATAPGRAADMEQALAETALTSARIGSLQQGPPGRISVV